LSAGRVLTVAMIIAVLALGGCGGGSGAAKRSPASSRTSITLLMATAPDSLDPAVGYTTEALEPDWLAYTPLVTYVHSKGVPGTRLIPGLATDLPTISDAGKTYTVMLRPGLVYSNGQPVRASDFTWAVERAIKLGWGGSQPFIISRIQGAAAFAAARAMTISGITTDDATGQITIRLNAPDGAFENVLAFPALAPVPRGTPFKDQSDRPPPGVGPYELTSVVPGRSFWLVKNPLWERIKIPGIPSGHLDVKVNITGNAEANALAVLHNTADVYDWADRIPSDRLRQIEEQASDRFSRQVMNGTYLIFLNVTRRPFSSQLAREAVRIGLDENTMNQLDSGTLAPGCFLLPPNLYGHSHLPCAQAGTTSGGDLARAKALVAQSGMAGTRVTVWSEANPPFRGWMAYYTLLLNQLGFRARLKVISEESYYATIGDLRNHPQSGIGDFYADYPNPVDFYQWLSGPAIQPSQNQNWGEIDDPYLNLQVRTLGSVPAGDLSAVASLWHGVERYVASQAYIDPFGYQTFPDFVSDRIDYKSVIFSPVVGFDWSSFRLR
jgi:peptide/nickel transport system substrate-binding protein